MTVASQPVAVALRATGRVSDSLKNLSSRACRGTSNYLFFASKSSSDKPGQLVVRVREAHKRQPQHLLNRNFWVSLPSPACSSAISPDKMSQIKANMNPDQVRVLLGAPTRIEQSETTGLTGEVDIYTAPNGEGRVVYLNKAVFKSEFVPGVKKS